MLKCTGCEKEFYHSAAFAIHNKAHHRGMSTCFETGKPFSTPGTAPEQPDIRNLLTHHIAPNGPRVHEVHEGRFDCTCPTFRGKGVCGHIRGIITRGEDTIFLEDTDPIIAVHFPLFVEPVVHCVVHLAHDVVDDEARKAILISKDWVRSFYEYVYLGTVFPGVKRWLLRSMVISWLTSQMDDVLAGEKDYVCGSYLHSIERTPATDEGQDPFSKIHLSNLWGLIVNGKCIRCRDAEVAAEVGV